MIEDRDSVLRALRELEHDNTASGQARREILQTSLATTLPTTSHMTELATLAAFWNCSITIEQCPGTSYPSIGMRLNWHGRCYHADSTGPDEGLEDLAKRVLEVLKRNVPDVQPE